MNKETRKILLTCGIIFLVVIICLGIVVVAGAGLFMINEKRSTTPTPTIALPTPMPTLSSDSAIDPAIASQMDLIQSQVIAIRGLDPTGSISRTLLSPDALRENVINDFLADYTPEDATRDAEVLAVLGLLPEGFDLIDFYLELYSEQIAGYYDDEVQSMYVVQGEAFKGSERSTYAHEYVHVLQDQVFDFDQGLNYNDDSCEADSERCAGIQSLIEGDATLTELNWFQQFASDQDLQDILDFYDNYESPVFDSAPDYMQQDFMFPYEKGQAFVQKLYDDGGYAAVDAAYTNVPVSTEQILHPEKYPDDKPVPVDLPDLSTILGEGWVEVERNVMGEWYTYLILAHGYDANFRIDGEEAEKAAAGWGGDTYLVYRNENTDEIVFVMVNQFDTTHDLDEYVSSFINYGELRWGDPLEKSQGERTWQGNNLFSRFLDDGKSTTWIIAPSLELIQMVQLALP
jgi:hypothetical protein